jgi:DNA-binding transcriptional LysR family regulator
MWYSPSLQQLIFLEAVLEEGNLVRAASRLHTTHSTISRGLKALSSGLGMSLFDKTSHGLRPNKSGRLYGSEVRKALEQARRAFDLTQYQAQKDRLPFRVGHSPYIHGQLLPLLSGLSLPGTEAPPVVLQSATTMQLVRRVLNGKLEAAFGVLPIVDKDLWIERIAHEQFAVRLPERHKLAWQAKLSARQLCDETVFWIPRGIHRNLYDQIVNYLRPMEFNPQRFHKASTITQALDFVASDAGVALVPQSAERFLRPGVLFKPLTDALMRIETAIFVRKDQMRETVKDFINIAMAGVKALKLNPISPERTERLRVDALTIYNQRCR